jgi:hypothetical protein
MSTLRNRGPPAGPCGAAELHEFSQYHYQTQTQRVSRISPERVSRISPVAHREVACERLNGKDLLGVHPDGANLVFLPV